LPNITSLTIAIWIITAFLSNDVFLIRLAQLSFLMNFLLDNGSHVW